MSARRTPWWYYVVVLFIGVALGAGLALINERSSVSLLGAPWIVPIILIILGIVVFVLAWQVHKYATTDPKERSSRMNVTKALYTLVLAKSLGIAGAFLAGWYAGQILVILAHADAPFYATAVLQCSITAVVCIIDMVVGIISEWLCQLPPNKGPENPDIIRAQERRGTARSAAKMR